MGNRIAIVIEMGTLENVIRANQLTQLNQLHTAYAREVGLVLPWKVLCIVGLGLRNVLVWRMGGEMRMSRSDSEER